MTNFRFSLNWCCRGRSGGQDDQADVSRMERTEEPNIKRLEELEVYYQIDHSREGLLGRGHFAEVYRGVDIRSGAKVAVKQISRQNQDVKNLRQEIAALLKVNGHRNIVQLYDVFIDQRMVVLVMELLGGGELFSRIVKQGAYTEREASKHFRRITEALHFMHQHGIVHRDLKPENLVLSTPEPDSEIKISDFGLSKVLGEDQGAMTTVCGTSAYAAPEVGISAFYGPKVDTWSLGVILFVVLAAYHPFDPYGRLDDAGMRRAVCGLKWDFEDNVWKDMSEGVKDLITKLLCPAEHRLTAEQILQHPWITENNDLPELNVAQNSMRNLRSFMSSTMDYDMSDEHVSGHMDNGIGHASHAKKEDHSIPQNHYVETNKYAAQEPNNEMVDIIDTANIEPLPYHPPPYPQQSQQQNGLSLQ